MITEVNKQLRDVQQKTGFPKKRGAYSHRSATEKAAIGRYACENGVAATLRHFKRTKGITLKESSVRDWKKIYLSEAAAIRQSKVGTGEPVTIVELPEKPKGRPPLLGVKLDQKVQLLIKDIRLRGACINSDVVIGIGKGLLTKTNRTLLDDYGGPIKLTKNWAKSVLKRMGYTKRRANSKCKVTVANFIQLKTQFLLDVKACVTLANIPRDLILNWDQTALKIVPVNSWTMEKKGSKRVELIAIDDKRQITGVFACSLTGTFLPLQLIYSGKTMASLPKYQFPSNWHVTFTENHWANESTMIDYFHKIILPYIKQKRLDLKLSDNYPALVLFDVFKGQCTDSFLNLLRSNHILYVFVPPNCTDKLQPLDLTINKPAKEYLHHKFQNWYSQQVVQQLENGIDEPVDLRLSILKPLNAGWLVEMYQYLKDHPEFIIKGFQVAGIIDILAC